MPDVGADGQWAVVVPVKRLELAKTRLSVHPALRRELALAMATDTVVACLRTPGVTDVVVVTDDEVAVVAMTALGARVVADEPDSGLNPALVHGANALAELHPAAGIVMLSSDLPALSAQALGPLLQHHAGAVEAGCVADAAGTGTAVLTMRTATSVTPAFGPGSWRRHVDAGAVDLTRYADPRLRRDVDTTADLAAAMMLGCGAATVTVTSAHPSLLQ
jgi:2-phospho-L-lactate guanylyltransferase